jgi:hypothetical protein
MTGRRHAINPAPKSFQRTATRNFLDEMAKLGKVRDEMQKVERGRVVQSVFLGDVAMDRGFPEACFNRRSTNLNSDGSSNRGS